MTLPAGHSLEATQALRQALARAVEWGLIDISPAKTGVDNPQPPRREMRPFDSTNSRAFRVNRLKATKTDTPRAVPLERSALEALDQLPAPTSATSLLVPATEGGYLDLHNWRPRHWRPAQCVAGITPVRRVYDLRHTFATFALRPGLGTFELSRYMGTSLINIGRTYGHLVRDSQHHAIQLVDGYSPGHLGVDVRGRSVDVENASVTAVTTLGTPE